MQSASLATRTKGLTHPGHARRRVKPKYKKTSAPPVRIDTTTCQLLAGAVKAPGSVGYDPTPAPAREQLYASGPPRPVLSYGSAIQYSCSSVSRLRR